MVWGGREASCKSIWNRFHFKNKFCIEFENAFVKNYFDLKLFIIIAHRQNFGRHIFSNNIIKSRVSAMLHNILQTAFFLLLDCEWNVLKICDITFFVSKYKSCFWWGRPLFATLSFLTSDFQKWTIWQWRKLAKWPLIFKNWQSDR